MFLADKPPIYWMLLSRGAVQRASRGCRGSGTSAVGKTGAQSPPERAPVAVCPG